MTMLEHLGRLSGGETVPTPELAAGQAVEVWLQLGQEHAPVQPVQVVPMASAEEAKWFAGQGPAR